MNILQSNPNYIVVGCGLSGSVIAERISQKLDKKVLIIEKREHIGGNCYDYIDPQTNIRINKYGAHLFHTNNERVWDYINRFDEWVRWEHKVLSFVDDRFVSIPVNITTINELLNQNLENKKDVQNWLRKNQIKYEKITNSEEMAKSRIGEQLYVKMIKDYTYKQWGKYPSELEKLVLARIPIRPNFDTRYFSDKYQALPKHGYTNFFKKLLNNPNITVRLNTDFFEVQEQLDLTDIPVIFTGPIDAYFKDKGLKMLEYRSIDFHLKRHFNCSFFQPNSVVNYPNKNVPYTRIVEYKHFLNQQSPHSIAVSETTNDYGDPYYPVPDKKNLDLYEKYRKLTHKEEVHFIGRLANYKYFNMDQSIDNAIRFFNEKISFIN